MELATIVLGADLHPFSWIGWLLVGIVAGAVADWIIPGKGFGFIGNMLIGILGAVIAGFVADWFLPDGETIGFWGSIVLAILGAAVLFLIANAVRGRRTAH